MFAGWGSRVARLRWSVLAVALVAVISAGVWGFGVFDRLSEGGYSDPSSESGRATEVVAQALGGQGGDVIAIYTPDTGTITDAALTKRIKERLAALPDSAVSEYTSYWTTSGAARAALAAEDKSSAIAVITLAGDNDEEKSDAYGQIEDDFTVAGAQVQLAGGVPLSHASSSRSTRDLASAELISLPIVLILLLLIFGSLVAASLPVLIGGCAVLGSLGVLHAIALTHDVNSFAVNVASLLGLGMAIDYGLFMVGRFREEQAEHSTADAVRRTVATAGRTVLFSATLLMTALAGLLLFPQEFLKSLAYGGLAAVFLAMLLSLTLLPAILAIIGPGVDKLPVRIPGRRDTGGDQPGGWDRLAAAVLRRPFLVALPILAVLLVLALPITDVRFGENDERVLPAGDPSRVAVETLKTDYPQFSADGVQLVVRATDGEKPDVEEYTEAAGEVPGIDEITISGTSDDVVVLNASLTNSDSFSIESRQAVEDLRALPAPENTEVLVGGVTARNVDSLAAIADKLPTMVGLLVGATLLLMFLAFGSILLPIKAVVMSALSLCATFGILVWIFQDGHGAGLLNVTPAPLEAGIVVLMAAVVFGLSTDYEVFLLSRMVEARTRGASTAEAVTIGLSRTGRVISAAALLLIVVTGAFALSSVSTMKFIGVGMIIALVLDATVVRMLLVPAILALFGDAAWWAPGPLRRLQERAGLSEHAGEAEINDWRPPLQVESSTSGADADTVTFALPTGFAAAGALAAAPSPASQTVVLEYDAVLDYIAEREQAAATPVTRPVPALPAGPGEKTTALPLINGTNAEKADEDPADLVELSVSSLLGLEPEKLTEGAAAYPALFADDEPAKSDPVSSDAAARDTVSPDAASSDAASSDAVSSDAASRDAASRDAVSSDAVSPDAWTATGDADVVEPSVRVLADDEPLPPLLEAVTKASADELTASPGLDPLTAAPTSSTLPLTAAAEEAAASTADDGLLGTATSTPAADEQPSPAAPARNGLASADEDDLPLTAATGKALTSAADDPEPPRTEQAVPSAAPTADDREPEPAAEPGSAAAEREPAFDAETKALSPAAPDSTHRSEPADRSKLADPSELADRSEPADGDVPQPVDLAADQPKPAPDEVDDLFAWRSDPRLANLAAPESDRFDWLPGAAPASGQQAAPAARFQSATPLDPANGAPGSGENDPQSANTWSGTAQGSSETSEEEKTASTWPPAWTMPEAALPYSPADRSGDSRPQTLSDWIGDTGRPHTTPDLHRPRTLDDLPPPVSAIPATGSRPQTLAEWLSETATDNRSRPEAPGDLPTAPVSPDATANTDRPEPGENTAPAESPVDPTAAGGSVGPSPTDGPPGAAARDGSPEATATDGSLAPTPTGGSVGPSPTDGPPGAAARDGSPEATATDGSLESTAADGSVAPTPTGGSVSSTPTESSVGSTPTDGSVEATAAEGVRPDRREEAGIVPDSPPAFHAVTDVDTLAGMVAPTPAGTVASPVASGDAAATESASGDQPTADAQLDEDVDSASPIPATWETTRRLYPTAEAATVGVGPADPVAPMSGAPGFIRRPQTLDEWLKGGPIAPEPASGAERSNPLGDLTAGGIRRPKTLDDWLSGATPAAPSAGSDEQPQSARPATLADHEAVRRRRSGNGGPQAWASESGEHPYDQPGRRPSSLADRPGSPTARKPADGGDPDPDPVPNA